MAQAAKQAKQSNFTDILDRPSTEVERPKPTPVGTYLCVVQGLPRIDKSTKKGTEYSEYTLKPIQAQEDVDQDALNEIGGLEQRTLRVTFWHTEDALYRLKEFFDHCQIPEEDDGEELSIRQRMGMVQNKQVLATVKHTVGDNGTIYANVTGTASAE